LNIKGPGHATGHTKTILHSTLVMKIAPTVSAATGFFAKITRSAKKIHKIWKKFTRYEIFASKFTVLLEII